MIYYSLSNGSLFSFKKKLAFPSGSKTSQAKIEFICDMPYYILLGSTIWKASYENEKDDKF